MMIVSDDDLATSVSVGHLDEDANKKTKEKKRERTRDTSRRKRIEENGEKNREQKSDRRDKPNRLSPSDGGEGVDDVVDKNKDKKQQKESGGGKVSPSIMKNGIGGECEPNSKAGTWKKKGTVGDLDNRKKEALRESLNPSPLDEKPNKKLLTVKELPRRTKSLGSSTKKADGSGGDIRKGRIKTGNCITVTPRLPAKTTKTRSMSESPTVAEESTVRTKSPVRRMSDFLIRAGSPGVKRSPIVRTLSSDGAGLPVRSYSGASAAMPSPKTPLSDEDKTSRTRSALRRRSDPINIDSGKDKKGRPPIGPPLEGETGTSNPSQDAGTETEKPRRRKTRQNSGYGSSDDEDVGVEAIRKLWRKGKIRQREMDCTDEDGESVGTLGSFLKPDEQQKTSDDDKTACATNKSTMSQADEAAGSTVAGENVSQDASNSSTKKYKQQECIIKDDILQISLIPAGPQTVKAKAQYKSKGWKRHKAITLHSLEDYIIRETKRGNYGGRVDIRAGEGTGFFHVKLINQRWTFVDPEGYLFISVGINSVTAQIDEGVDVEAFSSVYPTTADWASSTQDYLFNQLGFNTLGCWSDHQAFQKAGIRLPYCPRWSFMQTYCKKRKYGRVKLSDGPIPCFDPEFEVFCDEHARELLESCTDPWLLGHFSDNELPLRETDLIKRYLALPETDPGYEAAKKWLALQGKDESNISSEDNTGFCTEVISRYFCIVRTAVKKYDPNHLFLGARFHGLATKQDCTFLACAEWVDVVSINYFQRWTPEQESLNRWASLSGRPILIAEFSVKGEDAVDCDNATGAGLIVPTQKNRAAFYEHFTIGLMRNPNVIGWHWFRYVDKQGSNLGILDSSFKPYGSLASAMCAINAKLYSLSDYLLTAPASIFVDEPEIAE